MIAYPKLKKYQASGIEDAGAYQSEEFKEFASAYRSHLKKICKNNGYELVNFNRGHYYCSWFLKKNDHYIYMSFSDVRYFSREWWNCILYRTAKSDRDYTGGSNYYTDLDHLESDVGKMFARMTS